MAAPASLEGVELSSENVERAVLQFYHNSATQVRELERLHVEMSEELLVYSSAIREGLKKTVFLSKFC